MLFRRGIALSFSAVLTLSIILSAVVLPGAVSAYTVAGAFVNRATINLDNLQIANASEDILTQQAKDFISRESLDTLNNLIDAQVEGEYKNSDIMIRQAVTNTPVNPYQKDNEGCTSQIRFQEDSWQLVNAKIRLPTGECMEVLSKDLIFNDGALNRDRAGIWFTWVNQNTMVRVDGRDGEFVEKDPQNFANKFYSTQNPDQYVELGADPSRGTYFHDMFAPQGDVRSLSVQIGDANNRSNPPGPLDGSGGAAGPSCEDQLDFAMAWLVCALLNFVDDAFDWLRNAIEQLLTISPEEYNNPDLREAWSTFRYIASFLLLFIGLVMIIGQAVSKD